MELYKKYRPDNFDAMVGNTAVIASLRSMVQQHSLPHTLLFNGPSGCGKTTLARICAKELGCSDNDITELNMSHQDLRGIQGANEIVSTLNFKSLSGNNRVLILDEVDQMTSDAQKLFKKPLEDTPKHIWFFLCTTKPEKIIKDIITRATQISVSPIDARELGGYLRKIAEKENRKISVEVARKIADKSQGSVRKALVFLDQILQVDEDKQEDLIKSIIVDNSQEIIDLCRALLNKKDWVTISTILKNLKEEPESIRYAVLGYMNSVLLNSGTARACEIIIRFSEPFYNSGNAGLTCACYELLD